MKLIFIALALLVLSSQPVSASCLPPPPLAERKDRADVVVLGKVTSTSMFQNSAFLAVEQYYKGEGPDRISVSGGGSTEPGTVTSVDMKFEIGKRYVLFLDRSPSGTLRTNDCAGNLSLEDDLTATEEATLGTGLVPAKTTPNVAIPGLISLIALLLLIRFGRKLP